jgi:hypothetical protein
MDLISRTEIDHYIKSLGFTPKSLSGPERQKTSKRTFDSMYVLHDPHDYFRAAMGTELEHGRIGGSLTDVTGDNLMATARIVAAHLKGVEFDKPKRKWIFFPAYYDWLWWMEDEGPK